MNRNATGSQRKFKISKPRLKDLPFRCSNEDCPQHYQTVSQSIQLKNKFIANADTCKCPIPKNEQDQLQEPKSEKICGNRIEFYFEQEDKWVKRNYISERTSKGEIIQIISTNGNFVLQFLQPPPPLVFLQIPSPPLHPVFFQIASFNSEEFDPKRRKLSDFQNDSLKELFDLNSPESEDLTFSVDYFFN
jgi:hypothetical protein